jgi:hypothetical protein
VGATAAQRRSNICVGLRCRSGNAEPVSDRRPAQSFGPKFSHCIARYIRSWPSQNHSPSASLLQTGTRSFRQANALLFGDHGKDGDDSLAEDASRVEVLLGKGSPLASVASESGIKKKISWHTFRHTFSSILKGNGEDVKVVQELLRHSTSRMTLDTYTQALGPDKRAAQSKVVGMIRPKERVFSVYRDADGFSV